MMFFRSMILYVRLAAWVGAVIGCSGGVSATSQELSRSTAGPAVEPPALTARVADPNQKSAVQTDAPLPAEGVTLQALTQAINPLWIIPVASLSAIRERPIFSPSRRRPASPASVQPGTLALANQGPPFILVGAVAGETDGIGIFLDQGMKNIVRLKTQESHAGWTLTLVKGREATLQRGGEIAVLEIPNP
jgi:hypothetical protein